MSAAVTHRVHIQCYGVLEQVCGGLDREVEVPELPLRVDAVLERLSADVPALREYLPRTACAVGDTIVPRHHRLAEGETLVLIPPVSGG